MKRKVILITGAAGLLGANFSRHLLQKGYVVVGIDDLSGGYQDFLPEHKNFYFFPTNLEKDESVVASIFDRFKPQAVFHFAAYAAEGLSPFIRVYNYNNNVVASAVIINECIKHDAKLIFTSSMAVYGKQKPPFTEAMKQDPIDPYGIAKYAVELDIQQASEQFGLKYNIVRPHNVLGIYQNIWDRYRNVIGIFIRRAINGEPLIIYGDGEQTRAFSDIDYYMEPMEMLIGEHEGTPKFKTENEIFNIGADKYFSLNEVADLVVETALKHNIKASIVHDEPRHEAKHAFCDHSKAKAILNFKDETNLQKLVEKMFDWAIKEKQREVKTINYEVEKGIYKYWK